jgi:integrase
MEPEQKQNFDGRIAQANGRLKAAKVGAVIQRIGDRLAIRATFPPRPDSDREKPYQQRLFLGYHANPTGISLAEAEARKIGALIDCGEFKWEPYLRNKSEDAGTVKELIARFEAEYFAKRARSPKTETTWNKEYKAVFSRLPLDQVLTAEILREVVLATEPDTRTRQRFCMVTAALAKFAGIEFDAQAYRGKYSPKHVTPRDLPDDRLIAEWFHRLENPAWQWVYGAIATYGLRPHEAFYLDLADFPIVTVTEGKTGRRRVWPCYAEWAEQFGVREMKLPAVTGRNNSELGERAARYFKRAGLPFVLYDLRHCWAVRTLEFGLDLSLASQQMGHSAQVHTDTYHAWISERHHQRAYEAIMMRSDRPKPPFICKN